MNPVLSVIIISYNTKKLTKQVIDSIFKNDRRLVFSDRILKNNEEEKIPSELIIVDNDSQDGSVEYLQKLVKKYPKKKIKVILTRKMLVLERQTIKPSKKLPVNTFSS